MERLKENVTVAYFKATGKDDGWQIFLDMVDSSSYTVIARKFQVADLTAYRWRARYRKLRLGVN